MMRDRRATTSAADRHAADLVEGSPGIDAAWVRRRARGRAAMISYVVFGTAVAAIGAAVRAGPFGWLSGLEIDLLGGESPVLSGALGLSVLAIPIVVMLRAPRDIDHPATLGAQDAFDSTRRPRFVPSAGRRLRGVRAGRRWSAAVAALAIATGAVGWFASQRPRPGAGRPLPKLDRARLVESGAVLPPFARVVGLTDRPGAAWHVDRRIRQTRYRDAYVPLTQPSWRPGDEIDVVEKDALLPDDPPSRRNRFDPPGPREGALSRGLPSWLAQAMRASGFRVAPNVVVLEREPLDGVVPGPDWVDGFGWLVVTISFAFVALLMTWRLSRLVAMLDASAPDSRGGTQR